MSALELLRSPEYLKRQLRDCKMLDRAIQSDKQVTSCSEKELPVFKPPVWSLKDIRGCIPPYLFIPNNLLSLTYLLRDILLATVFWKMARMCLQFIASVAVSGNGVMPCFAALLQGIIWGTYWWFQGLTFTGLWAIGHECGHGAFSKNQNLSDFIGYITHTFLFTPYFSWKIVHHRHHMGHGSMERDEVFIPKIRSELGIPYEKPGQPINVEDYLGDTSIYTLFMLVRQQLIAFPVYLLTNASGQMRYPRWTNHFNPNALFFTKEQRQAVISSDIGLCIAALVVWKACTRFGIYSVWMYYGVPYVAMNHWIVMITYLQHTDPEIPHYRNGAWSFQRGAAATVDRNFLGWQGRFFLHGVAQCHVVHHFFPRIPWYNGEEATKYLKEIMGDHYVFSNDNCFQALWKAYRFCQFVEDKGDVVFYKDSKGRAVRRYEDK